MELSRSALWLVALAACASAPDPFYPDVPDAPDEPEVEAPAADEAMDAVRLLARASLDLRGVRPSVAEIESVEADPNLVDAYIDAFLVDPRFGDRVVAMFSEIYQTQADTLPVSYRDVTDPRALTRAIGEEPLRIVAWVAEHDLPYTEVVTADWTVADENIAEVWPVDYPAGATGWRQVRYTDARPTAGVLSTNSLWWRYTSTLSNANRGRANAISRILLCNDYLTRPIEFDRNVDLLDAGAIQEALSTNPGCVACHVSLDPIASHLWGFYTVNTSTSELTDYHPEREFWWEDVTGVAPGYFGGPSWGLSDLGRGIASDARFPECATRQVFEQLLQRTADLDDTEALTDLREAFLGGGLTLRALIRAAMRRPEYRSAADDGPGQPYKLMRPDLLASSIEELTGYRFVYDGYDMLTTDTYGLRVLAGGIDGQFVTAPAPEVTATMALSWERVAQAAATWAVRHDKTSPESATLFTEIGFAETPGTDRDAMVAQIQHLHLAVFGRRVAADGPEVEANLGLWSSLYEVDGDPAAAWAGVLSILLRDPDYVFY